MEMMQPYLDFYPGRALKCLAAFSLIAAVSIDAQDPSVVLRSIDNLDKRVDKVEGELGKIRKGQTAVHAAAARDPASDSLSARISARLDSLQTRLAALEAGNEVSSGKPEVGVAPVRPDDQRDPEIEELTREVRELTAFLKKSETQPPAAAPVPVPVSGLSKPGKPIANENPAPALALKGDIQIQGLRKLTTQSKRNNLDDFWGRLNIGTEYAGEDFQSKLNLRVFPEGFGFEPLVGATFDTTGQGSVKLQTQAQTRVVVNHAWVRFGIGDYGFKVGRFETLETHSENFGNYIDLGPTGKFMSRPASHNALQFSRSEGPLEASVMLGTNDRNLNRGFLRTFGRYAPSKAFQATAGWKANVFDRFRQKDEEILHRFDAGLMCGGLPLGWKAFAEAAVLQIQGDGNETPILVGIRPNAGKALDLLAFEMEWAPDRRVAGREKEILFNTHARKAFGRVKLDFGFWSDVSDPDADAFGLGMRMTSGIK